MNPTLFPAPRTPAPATSPIVLPPGVTPLRCLTICQPYAHLVLLPDSHPEHKRTENRTWHNGYRGPLLIHAGKSREWLEVDDDDPRIVAFTAPPVRVADLAFGAIVGIVEQVGCYRADVIRRGGVPELPWLKDHSHVEGPWCHVYLRPRRFATPIPYRGAQGFFNVPPNVIRAAGVIT